jgi:hypothetical protein
VGYDYFLAAYMDRLPTAYGCMEAIYSGLPCGGVAVG